MINKQAIKLIQIAVKAAGLRNGKADGQYRLLLLQHTQPNGESVTSCKQLNNSQLEDMLAICESLGWRHPDKSKSYYRDRFYKRGDYASFAQQMVIKKLAGDLGWNDYQLAGMVKRMTNQKAASIVLLNGKQAHAMIEAMKNMLGRVTGRKYDTLKTVQEDMEAMDGKVKQTCQA